MIIAGLVQLRREVDLALDHAVAAGRAEHDLSWDQVADLTGMTKRAALKRWDDAASNGAVPAARSGAKRTKAGAGTAPG